MADSMVRSYHQPLPKVDTPVQYSDFRGINLTPEIARCFDRTVYHHFSKKIFEENLTVTQYAYRDGCSCTDALNQIQYNYLKTLDDKDCNYVRLFAMDFLKAFHNVKHSLNSICQWACFKKKTVIIVGDLNLDRLRLDRSEGKILRDLEEVNDLHCLINEPTTVTANSQTLIDVMLANNPDLFKNCGVYNPEISDHSMIYAEMTEKVKKHTTKTLVHRQTKTTDFDNFNKDLVDAPWHVGEIFDDLDDAYDY